MGPGARGLSHMAPNPSQPRFSLGDISSLSEPLREPPPLDDGSRALPGECLFPDKELKATEVDSRTVLAASGPRAGWRRGWFLLRAVREASVPVPACGRPSPPVSSHGPLPVSSLCPNHLFLLFFK